MAPYKFLNKIICPYSTVDELIKDTQKKKKKKKPSATKPPHIARNKVAPPNFKF